VSGNPALFYQTSWTPSNPNILANPVSASYDLAGDLTSLIYSGGGIAYTPQIKSGNHLRLPP
jgi:hypothetical protein